MPIAATSSLSIVAALAAVLLSLPTSALSDDTCPYPCYPPPTGPGTGTPPVVTNPPPTPQSSSYPPPAGYFPPPAGNNMPYYNPPTSPSNNNNSDYGNNPPPDPILPYFPYYYRKPPHKPDDASTAPTTPAPLWVLGSTALAVAAGSCVLVSARPFWLWS